VEHRSKAGHFAFTTLCLSPARKDPQRHLRQIPVGGRRLQLFRLSLASQPRFERAAPACAGASRMSRRVIMHQLPRTFRIPATSFTTPDGKRRLDSPRCVGHATRHAQPARRDLITLIVVVADRLDPDLPACYRSLVPRDRGSRVHRGAVALFVCCSSSMAASMPWRHAYRTRPSAIAGRRSSSFCRPDDSSAAIITAAPPSQPDRSRSRFPGGDPSMPAPRVRSRRSLTDNTAFASRTEHHPG